MDFFQLALLAVIQGVTEFLPISSSGHLILAPRLLNMPDQGPLIDVALHFGSLFAVVIYFWRDVRDVVIGPAALVSDVAAGRPLSWPAKLALLLVVATIPLVIFGAALVAADAVDDLRTIEIIGWTTLVYGVILYLADRFAPANKEMTDLTWGGAVLMGFAQALALIPGTSRSGVTMTMARFLGFDRREAARIALLMAVPAILAASAQGVLELIEAGDVTLTTNALLAALLSFASAYVAIVLMMRWLSRATFTPFVIYRIILGGFLLLIVYADL